MNRDILPVREIIKELPPVIVTLGSDVDGTPLYYANIHTSPTESYTSHPGFIYPKESTLPYFELFLEAQPEISPEQKLRVKQFVDRSSLPLMLAYHLALNTDENPDDWQSNKSKRQWLVGMVGYSATGKSTLSKALVETYNCPYADLEMYSDDDENITVYLGKGSANRPKTIGSALTQLAREMKGSEADFGVIDGNGFSRFVSKTLIASDGEKIVYDEARSLSDIDYVLFGGPEVRIMPYPGSTETCPEEPCLANIVDTSFFFFLHHEKQTNGNVCRSFIEEFGRRNTPQDGDESMAEIASQY